MKPSLSSLALFIYLTTFAVEAAPNPARHPSFGRRQVPGPLAPLLQNPTGNPEPSPFNPNDPFDQGPEEASTQCEDKCRKKCKGKRIKDPSNCKRCIYCPPRTKPDFAHVVCIPEDSNKCPDGKVLDKKEGPPKADTKKEDLKCAIDDEKDCKKPKIPATRPEGKENDESFKPKCLDQNDGDNPKCDAKQQYMDVSEGPDGKAKKKCKPTRQYSQKKKSRMEKMKDKFKKRWEDKKDERAKKDEERKSRREQIEQKKKDKEKKESDNKKKKVKSYKCGMATAMAAGQEIAGLVSAKKAKRGGKPEIESYMDMVACYFDAEFVADDQFLEYFPSDVNIDNIGPDIDEDAYMKQFQDRMERADFDFWNSHDFCKRDGNKTLDARCQKRSEIIAREAEIETARKKAERALKRHILERGLAKRQEADAGDFCDMSNLPKRDVAVEEGVKKRNPFAIFVEIALFAARMAGSLLSRVIPQIARFSPRLSNLLKKSPKNLFKLAPKGQPGTAGSREAMKQAFRKLADHPAFKKCIKDGKP